MAGEEKKREERAESDPIIKKLSAKVIMGEVAINQKLIHANGGKPLDLFQIVGIAGDTKTGESSYGPWVALMGDFVATNLFTGEIMRSGKVFLPAVLQDMILGKMASAGQDSHGVGFAFIVGIKLDETPNSARGYVYYAKTVVQPAVEDPMTKLLASVPAPKIGKLPAPKDKDK